MRKLVLTAAALLLSSQALAQGPMGGGGQGGPGGMGGPGGPGGGSFRGGPRGGPPREMMKLIKREKLDKAVKAMFEMVDTNRDGLATVEEFRAVVGARRDALIKARFATIDTNHDGSLSPAEFTAWQRGMGSAAASDYQPVMDRGGLFAETINPDLGDDMGEQALRGLIEPLTAIVLVNANTNYDAGTSLEELLVLERKRFDAADLDQDGELGPEELQRLRPGREGPGRDGPRPGGADTVRGPGDMPPPPPS